MSLSRPRIHRQSAAIALAACAALLAGCASTAPAARTATTHTVVHVAPDAQRRLDANGADAVMAERVKAEFLHGWRGYRQYAWGRDALKPLSNTGSDWYAQSLLMTPVDALDTLLVMGLTDEADAARELIATQLSFDKDLDVKHFEIVIRQLRIACFCTGSADLRALRSARLLAPNTLQSLLS